MPRKAVATAIWFDTDADPTKVAVGVNGVVLNGSITNFNTDVSVSREDSNIEAAIEAAIKAKLQGAPFNVVFGPSDSVKLV